MMGQDRSGDLSRKTGCDDSGSPRILTEAAQAALKEAEARRAKASEQSPQPPEQNGRGGLDPVRYGDWEVKGLTSDF